MARAFRLTNRVKGNITETLKNWMNCPFESNILNQLWTFIPGFVLWLTWKERNTRIFKNSTSSPLMLWKDINKKLHETIHSKGWSSADLPTSQKEKCILLALNFDVSIVPSFRGNPTMRLDSPSHWDPPPENVFKLNFDGASKGNPGKAGFGGTIRNYQGNINIIFYGNLGFNSNNAVELDGLIAGL